MPKPIICLDFDGVIHSYVSGWKGARTIPDDPVPGALAYIVELLAADFEVVIHSSRARSFGGIWAMKAWLKKHAGNMYYDCPVGPGIERVRFARRKPPSVITIDDRALTFSGDWRDPAYSVEALRSFKPWNKRKSS